MPAASQGDRQVRSVDLSGPAGRLEAVLNLGAPDAPFAALVCHPHPLGGGTLHNKVVHHAMKVLNDPAWGLNWPVLRFNFRGAGLSEGRHDGQAESGDVLAALEWIENEYNRPAIVVGFSFGAVMALHACCGSVPPRAHVRAIAALGLPTQVEDRTCSYPFLRTAAVPKLFLSGDHDQFAPLAQLTAVAGSASEPKKLAIIPGADHFFTRQLEPMQKALSCWLKEQLP
jgi:alpha/beta superfamily hydrolase